MKRRSPERRAGRRAYTMIEVLMGLAILAVGATGIIALQKVTILGVTHGRNINAATSVAAAHLEALRADAQRWNSLTDYATDPVLLSSILPGNEGTGEWTLPAQRFPVTDEPGIDLGAADISGATFVPSDGGRPVAYCTHVRATPLLFDPAGGGALAQNATVIRLEVRTFWAKAGREVRTECEPGFESTMSDALEGDEINVDGVPYTADDYGWVFLATAVRRNLIARP